MKLISLVGSAQVGKTHLIKSVLPEPGVQYIDLSKVDYESAVLPATTWLILDHAGLNIEKAIGYLKVALKSDVLHLVLVGHDTADFHGGVFGGFDIIVKLESIFERLNISFSMGQKSILYRGFQVPSNDDERRLLFTAAEAFMAVIDPKAKDCNEILADDTLGKFNHAHFDGLKEELEEQRNMEKTSSALSGLKQQLGVLKEVSH